MKTRIIALTCVLTAIACTAPNGNPAQYSASGNNSAAPSEGGSTAVTTRMDRAALMLNAAGGTTTTSNGRERGEIPTSATSSGGASAAAKQTGSPDQAKGVDNTKINERDRGNSTLTPMDQGNGEPERKISADIRRGIVGDNTFSFTAKNVKIVTVGTKVTLRGPVKSVQEKTAIEALARKTAGVSEVDNQLEVKK